jgi:hypothetical protein
MVSTSTGLAPQRAEPPLVRTNKALIAAARHTVMHAKSVNEILDLCNKTAGIGAFAKAARDKSLLIEVIDIHTRATRRLGQMLAAQPKAKGTRGRGRPKIGGSKSDPPKEVTLENWLGANHKHIADEARKLAQSSESFFDEAMQEWRIRALQGNRLLEPGLKRTLAWGWKCKQPLNWDEWLTDTKRRFTPRHACLSRRLTCNLPQSFPYASTGKRPAPLR